MHGNAMPFRCTPATRYPASMRQLALQSLAPVALLLLAGCDPMMNQPVINQADGSNAVTTNAEGEALTWPFWPRGMRIHPASRLVIEKDTNQAFIEARMEFTDALGDTSKAIGVMKFDLIVAGLPANLSNPVLSWELPMKSLDENALHYDDVTRTYLYRLSLGEWSSSPDVTLIASFESVDGYRFDATQRFH